MAVEKVIRFRDYEKRSRHADAVDRDPAESAVIIILPIIRIERYAFEPETMKGKSR